MTDMSEFRGYANQAWTEMMTIDGHSSSFVTLINGRNKRGADCKCLKKARNCPKGNPGPPGIPGVPGDDGEPGIDGQVGMNGIMINYGKINSSRLLCYCYLL